MSFDIIAINPGSTSTKVALYRDEKPIWVKSVEHSRESLKGFQNVYEQFDMRKSLINSIMSEQRVEKSKLSAVIGRGGLLPPVQSGAYVVGQEMMDILRYHPVNEHASNLGAALAYSIAHPLHIPAYIYDPVTVDELTPIARITGLKEMRRIGQGHNLNMRAAAIRYSKQIGKPYSSLNIIVAHLGGGITFSLHSNGRMIDMISDDEGSFSPERAGGLPGFQLIKMATSGEYDYHSLMKKVQRNGGLMAHLGTDDVRGVEKMITSGDEKAALVLEAMAYNVAKNIGKLSVVVCGKVDAIILTGGIAYSKRVTEWITDRVSFIAPVVVLAGENEMESLAFGALRVLRGEEKAHAFSLKNRLNA